MCDELISRGCMVGGEAEFVREFGRSRDAEIWKERKVGWDEMGWVHSRLSCIIKGAVQK